MLINTCKQEAFIQLRKVVKQEVNAFCNTKLNENIHMLVETNVILEKCIILNMQKEKSKILKLTTKIVKAFY